MFIRNTNGSTILDKREKEIIYFALSRLLDITKDMDRKATEGTSKEWDKIDRLRDRFYTGEVKQ